MMRAVRDVAKRSPFSMFFVTAFTQNPFEGVFSMTSTGLVCLVLLYGDSGIGEITLSSSEFLVGRSPPAWPWYKLITDGSFMARTGLATAGGLLRDSCGNWQWGFAMNIEDEAVLPSVHSSLAVGIKNFLWKDWQVRITHMYREANFSAYFLAKKAAALHLGLHVFDKPPEDIKDIPFQDSCGVSFSRFVGP
ncbi:conserved hypothetical protein [Ricinus communis]|uniref:RNase H type-1 domain-containing protein n=1 Tax=Ricinus communis TaxID=3988 RepID=B9T133_RICCO|nr:conserved hypothetical protein [Ricinus communis]